MKKIIDHKIVEIVKKESLNLQKVSRVHHARSHIQHGKITVFEHSLGVAYMSLWIVRRLRLRLNEKALVKGALLHDYFLYDWHEDDLTHRLHGLFHPQTALANAKEDVSLSKKEADIILRHMFPLIPIPPKYKESWVVCIADKICATAEIIENMRR